MSKTQPDNPLTHPGLLLDARHYDADEISLVDLAKLLVKRKALIGWVFLACVLAGLVFALLRPVQYEYTTLLTIGRIDGKPIDAPQSVQSQLDEAIVPQALAESATETPRFRVQVSIPKATQLVALKSRGTHTEGTSIEQLHRRIVAPLLEQHQALAEAWRQRLHSQVERLQNRARTMNAPVNGGSLAAQQLQLQLAQLEVKLAGADMEPSRVMAYAQRSQEPTGPGRSLVLALAGIVGLMLGVLSAFMVEFASRVRLALADEAA